MDLKYVKDMPLNAEDDRLFRTIDFRPFGRTAHERQMMHDHVRLDYLYPGRAVVCLETKDGIAVIGDATPGNGEVQKIRESLPLDVRVQSFVLYPEFR
jgi:hypothetical protein